MEITHSPQLGQLVTALAAAQLKFKPIKKDTENPYYHSHYATLAGIRAATQEALAENGLVVIQTPIRRERDAGVVSLLVHSSGEYVTNELMLPGESLSKDGKTRFDAQSVGSAITYARRYTYQSLVGADADEDDDGNAASGVAPEPRKQPPQQQRPQPAQKGKPAPKAAAQSQPESNPAPQPAPEVPAAAQPASQVNNLGPDGVPLAVIPASDSIESSVSPVESTGNLYSGSDADEVPVADKLQGYYSRAKILSNDLSAAGVKAAKGVTVGEKLKRYALRTTGKANLTALTVGDWENVLSLGAQLKKDKTAIVAEFNQ